MAIWKAMYEEYDSVGEGMGKSVKKSPHQVGKSIKSIDKARKALPPGKRISKFGNIYYETRKNRSDLKGGI
jgi:hypothetical protein